MSLPNKYSPCSVRRAGWRELVFGLLLLLLSPGAALAQTPDDPIVEAMQTHLALHPHDVARRWQLAERLVQESRIDAAIDQLTQLLEWRPNDGDALQRLAELYDWSNRPQDALPIYNRLLRLRPNDPAIRYELARRYLWTNQIEASIRHLSIVANQRPHDRAVQHELVQLYLWADQTDQARALLARVVEAAPTDVEARRILADLYFWDDQPMAGIRHLEWIVNHNPDDLALRKQLAQQYFWTDQPEKGIEQLEYVVEAAPHEVVSRTQLAQNYFWAGRPEQGIRQLEWIVGHVDDDSLRYELAQRYFDTDQPDRGIAHLERLLQRHPDRTAVRRELAQRYRWANRFPESIGHLERLVQYTPTDADARRTLADLLFATDQPQQGFGHLQALVRQHPNDRDLRLLLADRYTEHERLAEALDQYRWLVEHPPTALAVQDRFLQLLLWAQRYDEVVAFGGPMLTAEPSSVAFRFHVVRALAWSGRSTDALSHIDTLLVHAPNHVDALLLGAEIQRWMPTEWPHSRRKLDRVLALTPDHDRTTTLLRGLRRDYGSMAHTELRHKTDSNHRTHVYTPLRTELSLGGLWRGVLEVGPHWFRDDRTVDRTVSPSIPTLLRGYGGIAGVHAQLLGGPTVMLLGTATVYENDWTPLGGSVRLHQPLGPLTLAARYRRGEMQESVSALASRVRTHGVDGRLDLRLGTRVTLSAEGAHTWLSDTNRLIDVVGTSQVRLVNNLALRVSYRYEDARQIFPDSRPYWTPEQLSTLSSTLSYDRSVNTWLHVGATYGLYDQEGSIGNDYGARLRLSPGDFHSIRTSLERFGAGSYVYRLISVSYTYRF